MSMLYLKLLIVIDITIYPRGTTTTSDDAVNLISKDTLGTKVVSPLLWLLAVFRGGGGELIFDISWG